MPTERRSAMCFVYLVVRVDQVLDDGRQDVGGDRVGEHVVVLLTVHRQVWHLLHQLSSDHRLCKIKPWFYLSHSQPTFPNVSSGITLARPTDLQITIFHFFERSNDKLSRHITPSDIAPCKLDRCWFRCVRVLSSYLCAFNRVAGLTWILRQFNHGLENGVCILLIIAHRSDRLQ